jgi:hypothetical protein
MLMTLPAAQSLASTRSARRMQNRAEHANTFSAGQETVQRWTPGDGISAVLIRMAHDSDLQALMVHLSRLDSGLEVIAAPAYVHTLRRHLSWVQRFLEMLAALTLLQAVFLGVAVVRSVRQRWKTGVLSDTQVARVTRSDVER